MELYDTYLRSRLAKSLDTKDKLDGRSEPLGEEEILECAGAMATTLVDRFGLEATLPELSGALEECSSRWAPVVELVADVLVDAKVARLGAPPGWRFSFVHRRFAEFFLASNLDRQGAPQLESIPRDEATREALALYCEIADPEVASAVAEFCWAEIGRIDRGDCATSDPGFRRAIHCLRFLGSAFRARVDATESFREKLGNLVLEMVTRTNDMLVVKLLVEGAGILTEPHIDRVVTDALGRKNPWISETALRACRHLPKPSGALIASLKEYMDAVNPFELWGRRSEFSVFAWVVRRLPRAETRLQAAPFGLGVDCRGVCVAACCQHRHGGFARWEPRSSGGARTSDWVYIWLAART